MNRGTSTHQGGGLTFMTFSKGKFVERVQEPTDTSKPRELTKGPNIGKTVHEELYDSITGVLLDIFTKTGDYGKQWVFKMDISKPGGEKKVVQFETGVTFGIGTGILLCLKNMDMSQDVRFSGYNFTNPDDKTKMIEGIAVYQSKESKAIGESKGELIKVSKFFTKEKPGGLPAWKKITFNGKEVWDMTDQIAFLEKMVNDEVKPLLPEASPVQAIESSTDSAAAPTTFAEGGDETGDDLPF